MDPAIPELDDVADAWDMSLGLRHHLSENIYTKSVLLRSGVSAVNSDMTRSPVKEKVKDGERMANGSGLEHETSIELSAVLYEIYNRFVLTGIIRVDPLTEKRKDIHSRGTTWHTWQGNITAVTTVADWNRLGAELRAAVATAQKLAQARGSLGPVGSLRFRLECPPLLGQPEIVSVPPPQVYWT